MQTLIIIGAMKCGTTSLFKWLSCHPNICPANYKDSGFFSAESYRDQHNAPVDSFEALFDCDSRTTIQMDASTACTKYPENPGVPERIRESLEDPRFIYVVRDPFERIESQFNHMLGVGAVPQDDDLSSNQYVSLSKYAMQLDQFMQVFERQSLLLLQLEELQQHPIQTFIKCCNFLEIQPKLLQSGYAFLREQRVLVHNRGSDYQRAERRKLTLEERQTIHEKLAGDMARFQQVYGQTEGIDVARWGFSHTHS